MGRVEVGLERYKAAYAVPEFEIVASLEEQRVSSGQRG